MTIALFKRLGLACAICTALITSHLTAVPRYSQGELGQARRTGPTFAGDEQTWWQSGKAA